MFEYRKDGWPLCPQCGDDELMSTLPVDVQRTTINGRKVAILKETRPWFAAPTDPMKCLRCSWQGTIPARELAESSR